MVKKGNIPWNKGMSKEEFLKHYPNGIGYIPFIKGHTPWNKGKKGLHHNPETEFKKGNTPWNKGLTKETNKKMRGISEIQKGRTYEEMHGKEKAERLKKQLKERNKGQIPPNKGKTFEEYMGKEKAKKLKANHSKLMKGRKLTKKHKEKISNGLMGRDGWNKGLTKETNEGVRKISEGNKGRIPHNKGKTFEESYGEEKAERLKKEHNKKIKGITYEQRFGKEKAEKLKEKMREKLRQCPMREKGKTLEESHGEEKAKEIRKKIREARAKQVTPKYDTKIEVKIQNYLKAIGFDFFTHHYIKDIKHHYRCDIWIPNINLIIECDGDYFHAHPDKYKDEELNERQKEQKERDTIRTKELIEKGFKVLRLWEKEIKVMGLKEFKIKIQNIGEKPII